MGTVCVAFPNAAHAAASRTNLFLFMKSARPMKSAPEAYGTYLFLTGVRRFNISGACTVVAFNLEDVDGCAVACFYVLASDQAASPTMRTNLDLSCRVDDPTRTYAGGAEDFIVGQSADMMTSDTQAKRADFFISFGLLVFYQAGALAIGALNFQMLGIQSLLQEAGHQGAG